MEQSSGIFLSIMMPFIVAIITASVTTNLAMSRFKKERSWEKKEEAYFLLIDSIKKSIAYDDAYLEMTYSHGEDEYRDAEREALDNRRTAYKKAQKIMTINYLFMRKYEVRVAERLFERFNFPDYMDGEEMATQEKSRHEELLVDAEAIARRELHVRPTNIFILVTTLCRKLDELLSKPTLWVVKKLS